MGTQFPTDVPGRPWWGAYCGDGSKGYCWAGPEASVLMVGPPRSGKTSCLIVPNVLDAPAAVVSTSTKGDVLEATAFRRYALGNCFVFDPTGSTPIPRGPIRCAGHPWWAATPSSPLSPWPTRWVQRRARARHSVNRPTGSSGPRASWRRCSSRPTWRTGTWRACVAGCSARDLREPLAALEASGHEMAQVVTGRGGLATEDRERSGIFSTTSGLLAAYRSEAALATTVNPTSTLRPSPARPTALYVCAPAHAQERLAPIVVALLEQIRSAVYARPQGAAPVVFALDEVASIAPLPSLPRFGGRGRGTGTDHLGLSPGPFPGPGALGARWPKGSSHSSTPSSCSQASATTTP